MYDKIHYNKNNLKKKKEKKKRKTTECTGFLRPPVASWQRTAEKAEHFPDANWEFAHLVSPKSEVSITED